MAARRAATLVELMVTLAVLGILFALLFPSIQTARESSRAGICRNNLHHIGVALTQYESVHGRYPMGAEARFDRQLSPTVMYGLSWWADLLSHLDENQVSDQLDRSGANNGWVYLNSRNGELIDAFAPTFWFCPSSPVNRFVKSADFQIAVTSYSGISGATSHEGFPETRVSRCCRSEGEISAGGMLVPNAVIRPRQVLDGLARTLMVGEQSDLAYTSRGKPIQINAGFLKGWLAGTAEQGVPPRYSDWLKPTYNLTTIRYRLNEHRYDLPGIYDDVGANNPLLSPHAGVVNLLYSDGSVHATNESMDVDVLKSLGTRDDAALTSQ